MFGPGEEQVDPEQSTMLLRMLEINILPPESQWADIMGEWAGGSHSFSILLMRIRFVDP